MKRSRKIHLICTQDLLIGNDGSMEAGFPITWIIKDKIGNCNITHRHKMQISAGAKASISETIGSGFPQIYEIGAQI